MEEELKNRFAEGAAFATIITGVLEFGVGVYGALYLSGSQPAYYYGGPVVVGVLFVGAGYLCWRSRRSGFIMSAALSLLIVGGQLAFDGLGLALDWIVVLAGLVTFAFDLLGYRSGTRGTER